MRDSLGESYSKGEPEMRKNQGSRWELRENSGWDQWKAKGVNGIPRESGGVNSPRVRGSQESRKSEGVGRRQGQIKSSQMGNSEPPPPNPPPSPVGVPYCM